MKVIHLTHPANTELLDLEPTVMALGYFDGLHVGHQKVIMTAKRIADQLGYKSAIMTFYPHPSVVLGKSKAHVELITPLSIKEKMLAEMGIDIMYVVKFDKTFAALLPQQFIDEYVIGLHIKHVVAGFDYTYGRLGKGTMETIPFHSRGEFTHTVIEKVEFHEEKVSSTLLRKLIQQGEMDNIPTILGRWYRVEGTVVHGDKRGRQIGFPTANVEVASEFILPPTGVYAVRMKVKDVWHNGVCNVGYKPTFEKNERTLTVEVHLLSFQDDIYDEKVEIEWRFRIRAEKKFNGVEELVAQIAKDKQTVLEYFKEQ